MSHFPNLTQRDFVTTNEVRWCPGCGDYAVLNSLQKVFAETGLPRERFAVVSGIGCSSRLPYYINTYGFHTIHGRAPTVATGVKVANPELSVWVITGDGDGLSIGGNHLLHALRRNVGLKIILFNNRIYGLTKGQYSPTSPLGQVSKTSPGGSLESPVNPLCIAIAAECTFVARTVDNSPRQMIQVLKAAADHRGSAFVEVLQNCVTFNDGCYEEITDREHREERLLMLEHGEPLLFGKDRDRGIVLRGFKLEAVRLGRDGVDSSQILVHDATRAEPAYANMLAQMGQPGLPVPVGVFRRWDRGTPFELRLAEKAQATAHHGPAFAPEVREELRALLAQGSWVVREAAEPRLVEPREAEAPVAEEQSVMAEQVRAENLPANDPYSAAFSESLENILDRYGSSEHPATVSPEDEVRSALAVLRARGIGSLPVVEQGRTVGILTERDIFLKALPLLARAPATRVRAIMTSAPEVLPSHSSVAFAFHTLASGGYRHLLVRDGRGNIRLISIKGLLLFIYEKATAREIRDG